MNFDSKHGASRASKHTASENTFARATHSISAEHTSNTLSETFGIEVYGLRHESSEAIE